MNKKMIKCEIIKDVLPLYIDDVVSLETKKMVEDHLSICTKCKKEFEDLKKTVVLPINKDNNMLKKFKINIRKKNIRIAISASLITSLIFISCYWFVFNFERVIPYSSSLFNIETNNDNQHLLHYSGNSYFGTHEAYSIPVNVNGEMKNVSFIYFTQTLAESPSSNLFNENNETETIYKFSDSEKVDAIYYADFNTEDITSKKDDWNSIIDRANLLWEAP